jgi:hypothetical protein
MNSGTKLFKLIFFYAREAWNMRTLVFLILTLFLSGFMIWGMPGMTLNVGKVFTPASISIVNPGNSFFARKLVDEITSTGLIEHVYVEPQDTAQQRLAANETLLAIVFPDQYFEIGLRSEERPPIQIYLNDRMPVEAALFVRYMNAMASNVKGVQSAYFSFAANMRPMFSDDETYDRIMEVAAINSIFLFLGRQSVVEIDDTNKLNTVYFVVSSVICLMTMQTGLLLLIQIQQERRRGIQARLLLTGISWWQPLLARQLTGLLFLMIGCLPLLSALFSIFPDTARLTVILAVLGLYWITALLTQAIGYIGKPTELVLLGTWLGIVALMLLGGCIYPEQFLPAFLRAAGKGMPTYQAFHTIYNALGGQPVSETTLLAGGVMIVTATLVAAICWQKSRLSIQAGGKV